MKKSATFRREKVSWGMAPAKAATNERSYRCFAFGGRDCGLANGTRLFSSLVRAVRLCAGHAWKGTTRAA